MAIELRSFASGDTDYIAKLNSNYSTIKQAIDALQTQIAAISGSGGASPGLFLGALFNGEDALIGPMAYKPTLSVSTATIAPGAFYLSDVQTIVVSLVPVNLSFGGQTADTYYIVIDSNGAPTRRDTFEPGSAYSVVWNGSAFVGDPVRVAPAFFDTNEAAASRNSTALTGPPEGSPPVGPTTTEYETLDERLEAGEEVAVEAKATADDALALVYELQADVTGAVRIRKVGVTVSDVGIAGAIQLDFAGTIIGWSVIANIGGTLAVEVCRAASSAPPAVPAIPNTSSDKISASAPIALSGAQSAASAEAGVATWDVDLNQWDVVLFNVSSLSTITRATLYLLIEEAPSSP